MDTISFAVRQSLLRGSEPGNLSALAERFPDADNMVFVATSGFDLPGVQRESIDFAFSFGTLVHCDRPIVEGYLASLNLALKAGARAHLQFSDKTKPEAAANPDFADTTPSMMMEMAEKAGFSVDVMDERLPHSAIVQLVKL